MRLTLVLSCSADVGHKVVLFARQALRVVAAAAACVVFFVGSGGRILHGPAANEAQRLQGSIHGVSQPIQPEAGLARMRIERLWANTIGCVEARKGQGKKQGNRAMC